MLACAKRLAFSGRAFLHYRQDNENSSVNSKGKVYCVCDEHAEIARFLDEVRPDLKQALGPVRAHTKFLNYRCNYDRLGDQLKGEFLDRFRDEMRQEIASGEIASGYLDGSIWDDEQTRGFLYFEPWEIEEIQEIVEDPKFYAVHRACEKSSGKKETIKRYWAAGGASYVSRVLTSKFSR